MTDENAIIQKWKPLVYHVLHQRFHHMVYGSCDGLSTGFGIDEDDLIQEGMMALLRASKKFDKSRGVSFKTYAYKAIKEAMKDVCSKNASVFKLQAHVFSQLHNARQQDTKDKISIALRSGRIRDMPVDTTFGEDNRRCSVENCVVHNVSRTHEEEVDAREQAAFVLEKVLAIAKKDERHVFDLRLTGATYVEIGRALRISSQRAHQIFAALKKKCAMHLAADCGIK